MLPSAMAREIATGAHEGQFDKGGLPYIGHPTRIAAAVRKAGYSDEVETVAWLHDVVEDTDVTLDDLRVCGFSEAVIEAVDAISQRKKESAPDYYARVMSSHLAHIVKWYDVEDNSSPTRMALLAPETQERLTAKYERAREVLGGGPPS